MTMALGDTRRKLEQLIEKYRSIINDDNRLLMEQNKKIVRLEEELKQAKHLIGLYEACINNGIKVDFPDTTGKGGNSVQNGSKGFNDGNIDFSDF